MTVTALKPRLSACPVCGQQPYVEEVEPWSRANGPVPWAVGCYRMLPIEHFVGVNGDDKAQAERNWNTEAAKISALSPDKRSG